jgi:hypothetical protein
MLRRRFSPDLSRSAGHRSGTAQLAHGSYNQGALSHIDAMVLERLLRPFAGAYPLIAGTTAIRLSKSLLLPRHSYDSGAGRVALFFVGQRDFHMA